MSEGSEKRLTRSSARVHGVPERASNQSSGVDGNDVSGAKGLRVGGSSNEPQTPKIMNSANQGSDNRSAATSQVENLERGTKPATIKDAQNGSDVCNNDDELNASTVNEDDSGMANPSAYPGSDNRSATAFQVTILEWDKKPAANKDARLEVDVCVDALEALTVENNENGSKSDMSEADTSFRTCVTGKTEKGDDDNESVLNDEKKKGHRTKMPKMGPPQDDENILSGSDDKDDESVVSVKAPDDKNDNKSVVSVMVADDKKKKKGQARKISTDSDKTKADVPSTKNGEGSNVKSHGGDDSGDNDDDVSSSKSDDKRSHHKSKKGKSTKPHRKRYDDDDDGSDSSDSSSESDGKRPRRKSRKGKTHKSYRKRSDDDDDGSDSSDSSSESDDKRTRRRKKDRKRSKKKR